MGCAIQVESKTLLGNAVFWNALFAVSQLVGSALSGSVSLFGDSMLMLVDVATYCANLYAEEQNDRTAYTYVAWFSIVTLVATTSYILVESVLRFQDQSDTEVNAGIMLGFTLANLVIDIGMVALFYSYYAVPDGTGHGDDDCAKSILGGSMENTSLLDSTESARRSSSDASEGLAAPAAAAAGDHLEGGHVEILGGNVLRDGGGRESRAADKSGSTTDNISGTGGGEDDFQRSTPTGVSAARVNILSAALHQGADTLRTVTTLVGSLLVLLFGTDSEKTDAACALIVSLTIIGGIAVVVRGLLDERQKEEEAQLEMQLKGGDELGRL